MNTFKIAAIATVSALALTSAAQAQDKLKIGLLTTLSGPAAALGIQQRNGFELALKTMGNKLGGRDVELIVQDDELKPDVAVSKAKAMVERDKVDFVVGPIFSNVLIAMIKPVTDSGAFLISPNAGTSNFAGKDCNANLFVTSYQNDQVHEVLGKYAQDQGMKKVYLIAPNYQAGKDSLSGFKRTFKGKVVGETYSKLGQLDYAAELADIRAAKPQVLYVFLPGGMGINFIKQFVGAGLGKSMTLLLPGFSADQDVIRPVGAAMAGIFNTAHWSPDFSNDANRKFVAAFEKEYNRVPTLYASQGYDTARLIDAAVRDVKGKLEDKQAVRKALKAARFESVRGPFRFNTNQYPIQNYYVRTVGTDGRGGLINKSFSEPILKDHGDAYVQDCRMK